MSSSKESITVNLLVFGDNYEKVIEQKEEISMEVKDITQLEQKFKQKVYIDVNSHSIKYNIENELLLELFDNLERIENQKIILQLYALMFQKYLDDRISSEIVLDKMINHLKSINDTYLQNKVIKWIALIMM